MRTAALTLLCIVAFGYAMHAQRFSLLPQVGFESSKTKVQYNGESFSPLGAKFSPQASLRLNYASKKGHGFFAGAATNRTLVSFNFTNPETGASSYSATTGDMQVRLEGGYQFTTKAISLGKSKSAATKSKTKTEAKKSCGSSRSSSTSNSSSSGGCSKSKSSSSTETYSYSRCGSKKAAAAPATAKNKGSWMRIQPSIGMAYIPGVKDDVVTKSQAGQTTYEYRAGNWQTGLIAGTSFEFGKNKTRLFTVSINYFKGLSNLDQQTFTTSDGIKATTTTLQSSVSGWDMRIGIPFNLGSKSTPKKKTAKAPEKKSSCDVYRIRYRCSGY